jgi:hypothetical protein
MAHRSPRNPDESDRYSIKPATADEFVRSVLVVVRRAGFGCPGVAVGGVAGTAARGCATTGCLVGPEWSALFSDVELGRRQKDADIAAANGKSPIRQQIWPSQLDARREDRQTAGPSLSVGRGVRLGHYGPVLMSMVRICGVGIGSSGRDRTLGWVTGSTVGRWCWSRSAASVFRRWDGTDRRIWVSVRT